MQSYLNYINKPKEIAELSIGFITMMQKGNVNGSSSCWQTAYSTEFSH